jgi:hypothetical protein
MSFPSTACGPLLEPAVDSNLSSSRLEYSPKWEMYAQKWEIFTKQQPSTKSKTVSPTSGIGRKVTLTLTLTLN